MWKFRIRLGRGTGVLLALTLSACGGSAVQAGNGNGGAGGMGPAADDCSNKIGLLGLLDLSVTPRADPNLELLALKLTRGLLAEQANYDRVVRDVAAIRRERSDLADIHYRPADDGQQLGFSVEPSVFSEMQAGSYDDWRCLNDAFVVLNREFSPAAAPFKPSLTLTLKGLYNLDLAAAQYRSLRGVQDVAPNFFGGDGPTICLSVEADRWHYVFDRASGDCLSGCIDHEYAHFTTDAAGTVTQLGPLTAIETATFASTEACH